MHELELENTYLARHLPPGLSSCDNKEILDLYIPFDSEHPVLRIRKNGVKYEMTKKEPAKEGDASEQNEYTIRLTEKEWEALSKVQAKRARKIRYDFPYKGLKAEVAVFKDALEGLVLVDVEFPDTASKKAFEIPDFCLADVTQDHIFAGGMLCGKSYKDIEKKLDGYGYKAILP